MPESASTMSSVLVNSDMSLKTPAVTSAGLSTEPNEGITLRRAASVASENFGKVSPARTPRSANTMPEPPEIDSTPTVLPRGRRPCANSLAMSTIGSTSSTSMRPDWRMAAR